MKFLHMRIIMYLSNPRNSTTVLPDFFFKIVNLDRKSYQISKGKFNFQERKKLHGRRGSDSNFSSVFLRKLHCRAVKELKFSKEVTWN